MHRARDVAERAVTAHAEMPGADVVRRAQQGDVSAFEQLYRANAPAIRLLCRRMLRNDRAAADLVQDVFVRAWEKLGSFRGESSFGTWVHRLAVNVVLGHVKAANRDTLRFDDAASPALGQSAERQLDIRLDVDAAIARLPAGARIVFVLHDVEGYAHGEIALMLGLAEGTVRAQLWRARRRLITLLDA